jgi:hypothetical protein
MAGGVTSSQAITPLDNKRFQSLDHRLKTANGTRSRSFDVRKRFATLYRLASASWDI